SRDIDAPPLWRAPVSRHRRDDARGHEQPDRKVDDEDRAPVDELREHATDENADCGAGATDGTPYAKGARALGAGTEGRRDDRERGGGEERRTETLTGAGGEQRGRGLRQGGSRRCDGKDPQAGEEHPLAAEQVSRATAEQEQAAKHHRIARDRPAELPRPEAEVLGEVGQRDV